MLEICLLDKNSQGDSMCYFLSICVILNNVWLLVGHVTIGL